MANVSPSKITNRGHCAGSILLIILLLLTLPFFHSWKESQCPCVVSQEKSGTMLPRRSPPSVDASAVEWNGIHGFRVMKVVSSSNSEETMVGTGVSLPPRLHTYGKDPCRPWYPTGDRPVWNKKTRMVSPAVVDFRNVTTDSILGLAMVLDVTVVVE